MPATISLERFQEGTKRDFDATFDLFTYIKELSEKYEDIKLKVLADQLLLAHTEAVGAMNEVCTKALDIVHTVYQIPS